MSVATRRSNLAVIAVFGWLAVHAAETEPDALVGIWASEMDLGPLVHGELTVDGRASRWRASIAGFDIPVQREKDSVRFNVPGGQGEFRGHLTKDEAKILGHWIQPASLLHDQRYTSVVELHRLAAGIWHGTVIPLEDKVSFYLAIERTPQGELTAFIRSPETNYFARRVYKVEPNGTTVTFSNTRQRLEGAFDAKAGAITMSLLNGAPPLQLTRRKDRSAVGFYPRVVPEGESYVYRKPMSEDDGWETATLSDVRLDPKPIAALMDKILVANPHDNPVNIQSLLIARHGKLVLEEYFYGFQKERPHDMRSASKTFGPMLVGLARDHGAKLGPDTLIYSLFSEYKSFANWDERKQKVRLRDIMTMTAGNACDDNDDNSPGNEDRMQEQEQQPDWYKYTLDLPMVRDPGGEHAIYCSADLNLVGGAVRNATGRWLPEFFEQYFAAPLQFHDYHLNLIPTGDAYMGGGAYLRPRDEMKLGQLYLNGGVWNGHRIVSKAWVDESVAHHSSFTPAWPSEGEHQYGYGWHSHFLKVGDRVFRDYGAGGNGGQVVVVIPDLDLVIGFNGGSYGEFSKWYRWELELVPQYIIPAAIEPARQ